MATKLILVSLNVMLSFVLILAVKNLCHSENERTLQCNYIAMDIPKGTSSVYITVNYKDTETNIFQISRTNFQSENWANIKSMYITLDGVKYDVLFFGPRCFDGLKQLQELHIHTDRLTEFDPETFIGLDNVKMLDLSGCVRMNLTKLVPCLKGQHKLPALENLVLSGIQRYRSTIEIDTNFAEALREKKITYLDLSDTAVSLFNLTAVSRFLSHLKVLNVSFSIFSGVQYANMNLQTIQLLNTLDISFSIFSKSLLTGKVIVNHSTFMLSEKELPPYYDVFSALKTLNASAIIPKATEIYVHNTTFVIDKPLNWTVREIIFRQNKLKYLDIKWLCDKYEFSSIISIDIGQNGLEYLHPTVLSCIPNLEKLDLSDNQFFKMILEDFGLFGKLFTKSKFLKSINFSFNHLKKLPKALFKQNLELECIDLSHNQLDQVTFTTNHLQKLKLFDLQFNNIKILDGDSLSNLDSTISKDVAMETTVINLRNNPLSCSECKAKHFLQWLSKTRNNQDVDCITEKGKRRHVNHEMIKQVQNICRRKTIAISLSVTSGLTSLVIAVTIVIIYKRRKQLRKKAKLQGYIRNLKNGEDFNFIAFLSYSSEDADFVEEDVKEKLDENLQQMTEIDRKLVCTGDRYLRPGFQINDEIIRCMEKASVIIPVISDDYCHSRYCQTELDEAYRLNKPIILMVKGHIDENLMMPTLKMLFKSNVRILWTMENDEYVLKTSWENVCKSLLDLAAQHA